MELSLASNILRSHVAELDLHSQTRLPSVLRLNPELVVPCRRITLSSSRLTIAKECVVILIQWVNYDRSNEWIPSITSFVHIVTLLLRPSADGEILLHIVVCNSSLLCSPWSLSVTVLDVLKPLRNATTFFLPLIDLQAQPFDSLSATTGLCNEVTVCAANAFVLPCYLLEVCTVGDRNCLASLLASAPAPTHVDVDANSCRSLYLCNYLVFTINLSRDTISNEILVPSGSVQLNLVVHSTTLSSNSTYFSSASKIFHFGIGLITEASTEVSHATIVKFWYITHYIEGEALISAVVNRVDWRVTPLCICSQDHCQKSNKCK